MPKRAGCPILMSLDDETLNDEIKQLIKESNVESTVYRNNQDSINVNYKIIYKQGDKDSGYVHYELFIVEYLCNILEKQFIFEYFYFKISQTKDQLDSIGGITDMVVNSDHQETVLLSKLVFSVLTVSNPRFGFHFSFVQLNKLFQI